MKKSLIFFLILVLFGATSFAFAQTTQAPQTTTQTSPKITLKMFYNFIRPAADVRCLQGNTALEKLTNCIITISKALRYFAIILFVIGITYTAGLMVIAPFKADSIKEAKQILLWLMIGFIILFIAEKIMQLIQQLAG